MKKKNPKTEFGRTVRDLMESRGIEEWKVLTKELNRAGWKGTRTTISHYTHGKHPVHPEFIRYLVEVLELNEAERRRLADAFAYGQGFDELLMVS